MDMRPKNLEQLAAVTAVATGLAVFGGAVGLRALDEATATPAAEQNAQVTACAGHLAALGHQASQSQVEVTPCRKFIDDFGQYQTITTYYEPGTNSSNNTGKITTDTVSYSLPGPQKFLSEHIITATQAEQNKNLLLGRDALFGVGGAVLLFGTYELGMIIPFRRQDRQNARESIARE